MPLHRPLLLVALALAALSALPARAEDKPTRPRFALRSVYLTDRVANARVVALAGEIGGRAKLTLDPNTCTLDPFGDTRICTEIAARPFDVELRQAKLADPTGQGRRIYRLVGALPAGFTFHLVVPRRRSQPHRLVVDQGQDRRRVITLEPWKVPEQPTPPKPGLCKHATYSAERKGGRVVLRATGEHPAGGYTTTFERLPLRIFPPQFRLLCKPPDGMAPAVMSPFTVETSFEAGGTAVREVIVHDAKGRHAVPVR